MMQCLFDAAAEALGGAAAAAGAVAVSRCLSPQPSLIVTFDRQAGAPKPSLIPSPSSLSSCCINPKVVPV